MIFIIFSRAIPPNLLVFFCGVMERYLWVVCSKNLIMTLLYKMTDFWLKSQFFFFLKENEDNLCCNCYNTKITSLCFFVELWIHNFIIYLYILWNTSIQINFSLFHSVKILICYFRKSLCYRKTQLFLFKICQNGKKLMCIIFKNANKYKKKRKT